MRHQHSAVFTSGVMDEVSPQGECQVRHCRAYMLNKLLPDAEVLLSNSRLAAAHYHPNIPLMATEQPHWGQLGLKTMLMGNRESCGFTFQFIFCKSFGWHILFVLKYISLGCAGFYWSIPQVFYRTECVYSH